MNKKTKIFLGVGAIALFAGVLTSCNSFCSNTDVTHFLYGYDPLNNIYFNSKEDAYEYMELTFKEQENYNENYGFSSGEVYFTSRENGSLKSMSANEDEAFGTVGNLVYIKPGKYELYGASTVEGSGGKRENIIYEFGLNDYSRSLISNATTNGILLPSYTFIEKLDLKVLNLISSNVGKYEFFGFDEKVDVEYVKSLSLNTLTFEDLYGYTFKEFKQYKATGENLDTLLGKDLKEKGRDSIDGENKKIFVGGRNYSLTTNLGYLKFFNEEEPANYFKNIETWNKEIAAEIGQDQVMSSNYLKAYEQNLTQKVSNVRQCITTEQGFFGNVSNDPLNSTVSIEAKASDFWGDWGKAFSEHGFLEGLLVYPISYLTDTFSHAFGMNGGGQILAVLLVTVIVRLLFMAITFPSTLSQQKQQALQPELAKLQQKYPNSNTNDYEKQRLAQAQMALYKKNKVHPFLSMVTMIIQFPLFIAVWNALQGSACLSSDAFLGLRLSDTIWNVLSNFSGWPGVGGWWTAAVLILLMSAGQILSMLIPQWINKAKLKKVQKTTANPTQDQQGKTMKFVQWFMIIFTIILGFTLPSAMGVYWLAGSLFNIAQTLIMNAIFSKKYGTKGKK